MPRKRPKQDPTEKFFAELPQKKAELEVELQEEARKAEVAHQNSLYPDFESDSTKAWNGLSASELQSDWEQLRRKAIMEFPEGASAKFAHLTTRNKLVAIASCLGWPIPKIVAASGLARSTISDWLKPEIRPDIKLFINEFNYAQGMTDTLEKLKGMENQALNIVQSLMHDQNISASTRLDACKWVFERNRGKPGQTLAIEGDLVSKVFEKLAAAPIGAIYISQEEETEFFAKGNKTEN
jgi:hypothetical protein